MQKLIYIKMSQPAIAKTFQYKLHGFWTSGKRVDEKSNIFKWMSTGKIFDYANWSPKEPKRDYSDEDCVIFHVTPISLLKNAVKAYAWHDYRCYRMHFAICEPLD
jgi:hypothetical protein